MAGVLALAAALIGGPAAHAADYTVTTSAELIDAINDANADPGLDTITVSGHITLEADLPWIGDDLEIRGDGGAAIIDGDGQYSALWASGLDGVDTLTVADLTFQHLQDDAIYSDYVGALTITGVTIDDVTGHGVYVYAGASQQVSISDVNVSNADWDGVRLEAYDAVTAQVNGVQVSDSGRVEPGQGPREHGGIGVIAEDNATVVLTDVSYTESAPGRIVGSGNALPPGITLTATHSAHIAMTSATSTGARIGSQITAVDTAAVVVSDLAMTGHEAWSGDIEVLHDASVSISDFTVTDSAAMNAELRHNAVLHLHQGVIRDSRYEVALWVKDAEAESGTRLFMAHIAVLDSGHAGALITDIAQTVVDSVTVAGSANVGLVWGGRHDTDELVLSNSTITGNADDGLVFGNLGSIGTPQATVESITVADNGGEQIALQLLGTESVLVTVRNSIVSGQTTLTPELEAGLTSSHTLWNGIASDFADFLGTTGPGHLVNVDPILGPLGDHGGFTPTRLPAADSPAIDAGDPEADQYAPDLDQRGEQRILGLIDLGAVEAGERAEDEGGGHEGDAGPAAHGDHGGDATVDTAAEMNLPATGSTSPWWLAALAAALLLGGLIVLSTRAASAQRTAPGPQR